MGKRGGVHSSHAVGKLHDLGGLQGSTGVKPNQAAVPKARNLARALEDTSEAAAACSLSDAAAACSKTHPCAPHNHIGLCDLQHTPDDVATRRHIHCHTRGAAVLEAIVGLLHKGK